MIDFEFTYPAKTAPYSLLLADSQPAFVEASLARTAAEVEERRRAEAEERERRAAAERLATLQAQLEGAVAALPATASSADIEDVQQQLFSAAAGLWVTSLVAFGVAGALWIWNMIDANGGTKEWNHEHIGVE